MVFVTGCWLLVAGPYFSVRHGVLFFFILCLFSLISSLFSLVSCLLSFVSCLLSIAYCLLRVEPLCLRTRSAKIHGHLNVFKILNSAVCRFKALYVFR